MAKSSGEEETPSSLHGANGSPSVNVAMGASAMLGLLLLVGFVHNALHNAVERANFHEQSVKGQAIEPSFSTPKGSGGESCPLTRSGWFPASGHWELIDHQEFVTTVFPAAMAFNDRCSRLVKQSHALKQGHPCPEDRIRETARFRWIACDSLRNAAVTDEVFFKRCLHRKVLGFVGDSLMVQTIQSFICRLAMLPAVTVAFEDLSEALQLVTFTLVTSENENYTTTAIFARANFLINDVLYQGDNDNHFLLDYDHLKPEFSTLLQQQHLDYVMLNYGHWRRRAVQPDGREYQNSTALEIQIITTVAAKLADAMLARKRRGLKLPTLAYRSSTVNHFLRPNVSDYSRIAKVIAPARSHMSSFIGDEFARHGLPVWLVDAELISRARFDGHPETITKNKKFPRDYTHFCHPDIPNGWVDAFLRRIWDEQCN